MPASVPCSDRRQIAFAARVRRLRSSKIRKNVEEWRERSERNDDIVEILRFYLIIIGGRSAICLAGARKWKWQNLDFRSLDFDADRHKTRALRPGHSLKFLWNSISWERR
jgi:hypothetical protein